VPRLPPGLRWRASALPQHRLFPAAAPAPPLPVAAPATTTGACVLGKATAGKLSIWTMIRARSSGVVMISMLSASPARGFMARKASSTVLVMLPSVE
jgi:hypothetical protein